MKFLSVCSGVEAASVAWESLGWEAVGFSDIMEYPSRVLKNRFPNIKNYGDMNDYQEWKVEPFDLLCGGTPCQSFSIAGLRAGLTDPRGNLALVFAGILDKWKPRWFLWENVTGVLSSNGGRDFASLQYAFDELGYSFAWRVFNAENFGSAARRPRVFVVGHLGDDWRPPARVLFEAERGDDYSETVRKVEKGATSGAERGIQDGSKPFALAPSWGTWGEDIAPCLLKCNGMHVYDPGHPLRRLTEREAERLQGFPEDWTLLPEYGGYSWKTQHKERVASMGNSWCVPVVRWIGERIDAVDKGPLHKV